MGVVKPFQAAKSSQLFLWRHGKPPPIAQLLHLLLDVPPGFGRERLDEDGAVGKRSSVQVHQLRDTLGLAVGHARNHKTGVTVPQEHDFVEILELDEIYRVSYVGVEVDFGAREVHSGA